MGQHHTLCFCVSLRSRAHHVQDTLGCCRPPAPNCDPRPSLLPLLPTWYPHLSSHSSLEVLTTIPSSPTPLPFPSLSLLLRHHRYAQWRWPGPLPMPFSSTSPALLGDSQGMSATPLCSGSHSANVNRAVIEDLGKRESSESTLEAPSTVLRSLRFLAPSHALLRFLLPTSIASQGNHLSSDPCLRGCFQGFPRRPPHVLPACSSWAVPHAHILFSHNCLRMAQDPGVSSLALWCCSSSKIILGSRPSSGQLGSLQSLGIADHRPDLKGSAFLISFKNYVRCSRSYQVTGTGS